MRNNFFKEASPFYLRQK